MGTYLALTGLHCDAGTAIAAGLADICIKAEDTQGLIDELARRAPGSGHDVVGEIIDWVAAPVQAPDAGWLAMIDRCFVGDSIETIADALAAETSPEADVIGARLALHCPTSLKVTLRLLRAGRTMPDLEACLAMELAAARHVLVLPDFREGVRATLVDKDRAPRWQPARLQDVDDAQVASWLIPGIRVVEGGHEHGQ